MTPRHALTLGLAFGLTVACGDDKDSEPEVAPDGVGEVAAETNDVTESEVGDTAEPDVEPDVVLDNDVGPEVLDVPLEVDEGSDATETSDVPELASGCGAHGDVVQSDDWAVVAGVPRREVNGVRACMTFARQGGVETRGGGVCLVADLSDGATCTTAQDCTDALGPAVAGGFHYCTAPAGETTKTCWTRPGPGDRYCVRSPSRTPDTYETPLVPAHVLARATRWMSYACMADAATPAGCGSGDPEQSVSATSPVLTVADLPMTASFYGVDGNFGDGLTATASIGELWGMAGTFPGSTPSPDLAARMLALNPETVLAYAPETYDAVVAIALAAHVARANTAAAIAEQLAAVTTKGERCTSYAACVALIEDGKDIDYDGESGAIELTAGGEPARAPFGIYRIGADSVIDWEGGTTVTVGDPANASQVTPAAPARDVPATGGALTIGGLLPSTGPLDWLGAGMRLAAELAVADINAAGGVNGVPLEIAFEDEGGFEDELVLDAMTNLLASEVDVVLGAVASGQSLRVIDAAIAAGVPMVSPSNTANAFTDYVDAGLYFRTAPPDVMQARALAEVVVADGNSKVAIVAIDDTYGLDLAASITTELVALGLAEADISVGVYADEAGVLTAVEAIAGAAPDAVLFFGFPETIDIVRLLAFAGLVPTPPTP